MAVSRTARGVMTVRITGVADQTVQVQEYYLGRWESAGEFPAAATTTVSGLTSGTRYRVVVPDTTTILGTTSSTITG